jgi:hypothetical protein
MSPGGVTPPVNKPITESKQAAWRNLRLTFAAWNSCGLGAERIRYIQEDIGCDITVLSELHGAHRSFESANFICGGDPVERDPAAGVALVLSNRVSALVKETGHYGARIVWAKLGGLFVDLWIVGVYIPHKARKAAPFQADTLAELSCGVYLNDHVSWSWVISMQSSRGVW